MSKRPSSGLTVSSDHPAVAFQREVLTVQAWATLRQAFLAALQDTARHGITWKEPSKLWRHSQEALGKWILSQIARVKGSHANAEASPDAVDAYMAALHFFPSAADFAQFTPHGHAYDEQLIRDLTIKCEGGAHDAAVIAKVKALVEHFNLASRCDAARQTVEQQLASALDAAASMATASVPCAQHLARPVLRRLEEDDPARSPSQRRIKGPIAELSVQWPKHLPRAQTRNCPPVSLPWAAMQKLKMTYTYFNRAGADGPHADEDVSHDPLIPLTREESLLYRTATVALRYEGGLATGSLQLCADTSLKQHLHAQGYHLMDLCASPINAYMGVPAAGRFLAHERGGQQQQQQQQQQRSEGTINSAPRPSSLEQEQEQPNFFCSAFVDTDRYFGSLGSALRVDPLALARSTYINPERRPLLLTLDVPYDEDLCEMLFQKLITDMRRAEAAATNDGIRVDYVLVLPLWWSIPMRIRKHLFSNELRVGDSDAKEDGRDDEAAIMQVVEERSAMLKEGYQVPYHWPEDLAEAAGDAQTGANASPAPWVCFDGLFVGNSGYAYFCTATNRWLQGVTATEVIGLQQPQLGTALGKETGSGNDQGQLLARSLKQFYLE